VVLLAIFFPEFDYPGRALARLHDFAHVPLFALVAIGLSLALAGRREQGATPALLLRAWLAAFLAGILVELGQARRGRVPEVEDIVADAAGATAGLLLVASRRWRPARRRAATATALALVLAFLAPVAVTFWDEVQARRAFPLIADLEGRLQVDRFGRWRCELRRVSDPEQAGNHMLEARFLPDIYPRLRLRDMPMDWRGYRVLRFTCLNPGRESFWLVLRINDDHHRGLAADWYTLRMDLAPGRHEIEVPLARVAEAPAGRAMDMGALQDVILYTVRLEQPATLLFDDFRLEP
jgi:VanZ family protein